MTIVVAVQLDDGGFYMASDSAVGYENGYRRGMPVGKWWKFRSCVIGESGADLHLSRIRTSLTEKEERWQVEGLVPFLELTHIQAAVYEVQDDTKGDSSLEGLDAELLYCGPEGMYVVGGDGGIIGPYDYTAVGHGAAVANPILEYALRPSRMRKRSKTSVERAVFEAFRITERYCDSVCRPFYSQVFYV